MEEYLRKLSSYVAEHPPDMYSDDVHTILDALFWAYCEAAGADNENVQQRYDTLQQHLQRLPSQDCFKDSRFLYLLPIHQIIGSFIF